MTTVARKGQMVCETANGKKKTISIAGIDPAASEENVTSAMVSLSGLQKHTLKNIVIVDSKTLDPVGV